MTERVNLVAIPGNDPFVIAPSSETHININPLAPAIALPDIILSDPDGDEQVTATLELDTDPYYASILRNGVADNLYNPVTGKWEITGSISQVNTALSDVMFVPDNGFAIPTSGTSISVEIKDQTQTKKGNIWIMQNQSFFEILD